MIGLDANILVRYLTQDDPAQAAQATELIEHRLTGDEPGFVSVVAVAEIVWVLRRHYRFDRKRIVQAVELMLAADTLVLEREREVFLALDALNEGAGEFADALIGALSMAAGCSIVLSFDRRAVRLPGFEHP
jgi:predicted nucleic-acid-binding protein